MNSSVHYMSLCHVFHSHLVPHSVITQNQLISSNHMWDESGGGGTEGSSGREGIVAVDPHCPGPHVVRNGERRFQILCDYSRCEAVCGPVGAFDDVNCVFELDDGHDRAEDLLLGDCHVVLYVGEHRRLNEETLVTDSIAWSRMCDEKNR